MIHTGISGIDDMLGGGIPDGSRTLYSMEPGVDGQLFMVSTLNAALSEGKKSLIIVPYATTPVFLQDFSAMMGETAESLAEKVHFIDSAERVRIIKQGGNTRESLRLWQEKVHSIVQSESIDVIFVYLDLLYDDYGLDKALSIFSMPKTERQPSLILEHLNLEGESCLREFSDKHRIDLIISISSGFRYIPLFNFFTLVHVSWMNLRPRSVPFIITDGKIVPYIPKIVITGPSQSGKSTFVTSASDHRESVERSGLSGKPTTVAMDFGWMHGKSFDITLYGTPGEERFDPIIPQLVNHAMGVVLVIDVTRPEQLERGKYLIHLSKADRLPLVVAANKVDLPNLLDEKQIRTALNIRHDVPVHFISSTKQDDVRHVIESMVDHITRFTF